MSLKSREARKLAAASVTALALLGAASSAQAASVTLNYSCNYPLIGPQPLSVKIDASIPTSVPVGDPTGAFTIKATATASGDTYAGLKLIGAASVDGFAKAKATITGPNVNLPLSVPIGIQKYTIPSTKQNLVLTAGGSTPSLSFGAEGAGKVTVDSLALNLTARDASGKPIVLGTPGVADTDNNPNTFPVPCTMTPTTQSTTLATWTVTPAGSAPGTIPAPQPTITPEPVPAATDPSSSKTTVDYTYGIKGTAGLKTLIRGSLPLTGTIAANVNLVTGAFTGTLNLAKVGATLQALGVLPVTATVAIVPTEAVSGTLINGVLLANAKVRIKLPWVALWGIPLGGGANCQANQISTIALKSTDPFFKPLAGGTLAATFAISDLSGCGFLNGIISPLTAGGGNSIALGLAPTA